MTVYADVLIAVNTFINFFILLFCAKLNKLQYKTSRLILGAISGGVAALSIFLTINAFYEIVLKTATATIMVLIAFGYYKIKIFIRNVALLFLTTYLFAGIMFGIWMFIKPGNILINNSVVYFDVSVTFLIIATALIYFIISIIGHFLKREAISAKKCRAKLFLCEKCVELNAIFDTGNSLKDPFSDGEVITVNSKFILALCEDDIKNKAYSDRYRVLPCRTVTGDTLLEGIRCDSMQILLEGNTYSFKNPIAVISKTEFTDEFDAVLAPEILTKMR